MLSRGFIILAVSGLVPAALPAQECSSLLESLYEPSGTGELVLVRERCLDSRGATLFLIDDPNIPMEKYSRPVNPSESVIEIEIIELPPTILVPAPPETNK